jgi:hypothetical protein
LPTRPSPNSNAYERHRTAAAERQRLLSAAGRDIAPIPPIADTERRARTKHDLATFCTTYLPRTFYLPFADAHRSALAAMQHCILSSGQTLLAMPRGYGKTTLALAATLWAILHGHRRYALLVAATARMAEDLAARIRDELATNELLAADWPEVCHPIRATDGIAHRCPGQTYHGQPTHLRWTRHMLRLPAIPGPAYAAIIRTAGLTGAIRGQAARLPDGRTIRPDLILLDDPQTDASAHSPRQTDRREQLLQQAIAGLASPTKPLAILMTATPIAPDDLAERYLDPERHPHWHRIRIPLLRSLPTRTDLWDQYRALRAHDHTHGTDLATDYYRTHQQQMDAGADPTWPHLHSPDQLSAIQYAMDLLDDLGPAAFAAEYQLQPARPDNAAQIATPRAITARLSHLPRATCPPDTHAVTIGIDTGAHLHYYAILAWAHGTPYIIDYGPWPPQPTPQWDDRQPAVPIATRYPGPAHTAAIAALRDLLTHLLRPYPIHASPNTIEPKALAIDANWHELTDAIYTLIATHPRRDLLWPAHGRSASHRTLPLAPRPGDRTGPGWRITRYTHRPTWTLLHDPSHTKTYIHDRLRLDPSAGYALPGDNPADHATLADHLTAEQPITATRGQTRWTDWQPLPNRQNHLLDALVLATVVAQATGQDQTSQPRKISFAEQYRQRRAAR